MTGCTNPKCNAPEVSCSAGEMQFHDCPYWNGAVGEDDHRATVKDGETRLPWSGAALGTTDLPFLTARSEPKLLAVVGPHNAGKTTLLGSWYQLIGRTGRVGDALFAGSYSLEGWEAVAHALRWDGGVPGFPPHTPSGVGRRPGLLHLALRRGDRVPADYLFADAPGEWFHRWGVDASAADAEGARWLGERASAFLVVADCEALSGEARGEARASLVRLIRRVGAVRGNRPVALVWAKADLSVAPGIRDAIVSAMELSVTDFAEFHTSVVDFVSRERPREAARSLLDLLDWSVAQTKRGFTVSRVPIEADDPFFLSGSAT